MTLSPPRFPLTLLFLVACTLVVAANGRADEDDAPATAPHPRTGEVHHDREAEAPPEAQGRLDVVSVTLKGVGELGREIELRYHLVDVTSYPGHPYKATFIGDEETRKVARLAHLEVLPVSTTEAEVATTPPSILTFWDPAGAIRPGKKVAVAVAGLGVEHVVPKAGPEYREEDLAKGEQAATGKERQEEKPPPVAPGAKLEVLQVELASDPGLVYVRFRTVGIPRITADGAFSYLEDPATGERYRIVRVPRIGLLAPRHLVDNGNSYMVIRNTGNTLKAGQKVTVVVAGVRQEGVEIIQGVIVGQHPPAGAVATHEREKKR